MNLLELKREIELVVDNSSFELFYDNWLNDAVLTIASDFELPSLKLISPVILHVTNASWLYDLPGEYDAWVTATAYVALNRVTRNSKTYECILAHTAGATTEPGIGASWATNWVLIVTGSGVYHKKVLKCRNSNTDLVPVFYDMNRIDSQDPDHDDTGTYVDAVAVQDYGDGGKIATYPMANDSLSLWFYRKPVQMTQDNHSPDGIPAQFHSRVLIPKALITNFRVINQFAVKPLQQNLLYWEERYKEGLYGSPRGEIGMINYFSKDKSTRRHGGRDPLP
jgi:hypothetical protein